MPNNDEIAKTKEAADMLKKLMLDAVGPHLKPKAFEVPGSCTPMITALGELLIFFSIGPEENWNALDPADKQWWKNYCQMLSSHAR